MRVRFLDIAQADERVGRKRGLDRQVVDLRDRLTRSGEERHGMLTFPGLSLRRLDGIRTLGVSSDYTWTQCLRLSSVSFSQCSRGPTPARAASHLRARLQPQALLILGLFPFHRPLSTTTDPPGPERRVIPASAQPSDPLWPRAAPG